MRKNTFIAALLFSTALLSFLKNEVIGQVVGSMAGTPTVTQSGAFTYAFPLALPPGVHGMMPNLPITYNSQAGVGALGLGWDIGGLSSITRSNCDLIHDNTMDAINFNSNDVFLLDGQRLVPTGSGTYSTCVKNFQTINSYGVFGSGPAYFNVETKDGIVYEYGNTLDSRLIAPGRSDVLMWPLDWIHDKCGNEMKFHYINDPATGTCYIDKITYAGYAGLTPVNEIDFTYDGKLDANFVWYAGSKVTYNQRLKKIEIKQLGSTIHQYDFIYSDRCLCSKLISITETGQSGSTLPSTTINWFGDNPYITEADATFAISSANQGLVGDFNGDGLSDFLEIAPPPTLTTSPPPVYYNLYNGNGADNFNYLASGSFNDIYYIFDGATGRNLFTKVNTLDWDGDGRDDEIVISGSVTAYEIWLYRSNGSGFDAPVTLLSMTFPYADLGDHLSNIRVAIGDFVGNSTKQILVAYPVIAHEGTSEMYLATLMGYNTSTHMPYATTGTFTGEVHDLFACDFDGDGKDELFTTSEAGVASCNIYALNYSYDPSSHTPTGTLTLNNIYTSTYPNKDNRIFVGDFNGDGKKDLLVWSSPGSWNILYSTGQSYDPYSMSGPGYGLQTADPDASPDDNNYLIADFNGDGKDDIMEMYQSSPNYIFRVYTSYGNGFTTDYQALSVPGIGENHIAVGDFNGDGNADVLIFGYASRNLHFIDFYKNDQSNLVQSIDKNNNLSSSAGLTYNVTYLPLAQDASYTMSSLSYPFVQKPAGSIKVAKTLTDNIVGNHSYVYTGASTNVWGLGSRGFQSFIDYNNATSTYTNYQNDIYSFESVVPTTITRFSSTTGATIDQTLFVNSNIDVAPNIHIVYPVLETKLDYTNGSNTTTNYVYSSTSSALTNYGQPDQVITSISGQETRTTDITYCSASTDPNYYNWCKPQQTTVTIQRTGKPAYSRTTNLSYNSQGVLYTKTVDPGTSHQNVYTYYTDGYGNVIKEDILSSPSIFSSHSFSYSSDGRFMAMHSDPAGHTESYTYNAWGLPLTSTNINALITTNTYDDFNRLTTSTSPTGITKTISYSWATSLGTMCPSSTWNPNYAVTTTTSGLAGSTIDFYDFYGRKIRTTSTAFDGSTIYQDATYNNNNTVSSTTAPFSPGSSSITTSFTYDDLGREIQSSNPMKTIATTYTPYGMLSGITISTTNTSSSPARTKSITKDGTGKIVSVNEGATSIDNDYNSNGKPDRVIINGTSPYITVYAYDLYGNALRINEPSRGLSVFTYDSRDRLTTKTDPNSHLFTYAYDVLDRIISKTNPDGRYSYAYDAAGVSSYGHLCTSTSPYGTSNQYTFDAFSRMSSKQKMVAGTSMTTTFNYDGYNHLIQTIYPSGDIIKNSYNIYGYFNAVTIPVAAPLCCGDVILWTIDSKNAFGENTQESFGPYGGPIIGTPPPPLYEKINSYSTYGFLTNSSITNNIGTSISDFDFSFDPASSDLLSRNDINRGSSEIFAYDNLDRLTSATQAIPTPVGGVTYWRTNTVNYNYGREGNLVTKDDISPDPLNYSIYQISSITNPTTVIPSASQNITYTPFDKVKHIDEGGNDIDFTYDPDDERVKADYTASGPGGGTLLEGSQFYTDNYERLVSPLGGTVQEIAYVMGGNKPVAMIVHDADGTHTYYLNTDFQGSIMHILDDAGGIVEERSYDAWGRMRNPATLDFSSIPAYSFSRGYIGQEFLSNFNIINLNGRLYDPLLGRMLSTDPIVGDNTNSQAYNKYSYALNNPLKHSDKTGNWEGWDDLAAILIGGGINVFTHWSQITAGGGVNWQLFVGAFANGAIAGEMGLLTGGAAWTAVAPVGIGGSIAGGAVSGFVASAVTSPVLGLGNHSVFGDNYNFASFGRDVILGTAGGGVTSGITATIDALTTNINVTTLETASLKELPTPLPESDIPGVHCTISIQEMPTFTIDGSPGATSTTYATDGQMTLTGGENGPSYSTLNRNNFRDNLSKLTGENPADAQAHHVFPQEFRERFKDLGINIDDPQYGSWWEASDHRLNAYDYNSAWRNFLRRHPTQNEALDFGRSLMSNFGIPVNY